MRFIFTASVVAAVAALEQPLTCQPSSLQIPIFHIIGNVTRYGDMVRNRNGSITRCPNKPFCYENINDANGVFVYKGLYHVFHQCCQNHWDHVVSKDVRPRVLCSARSLLFCCCYFADCCQAG
jgi:hypothetical protein